MYKCSLTICRTRFFFFFSFLRDLLYLGFIFWLPFFCLGQVPKGTPFLSSKTFGQHLFGRTRFTHITSPPPPLIVLVSDSIGNASDAFRTTCLLNFFLTTLELNSRVVSYIASVGVGATDYSWLHHLVADYKILTGFSLHRRPYNWQRKVSGSCAARPMHGSNEIFIVQTPGVGSSKAYVKTSKGQQTSNYVVSVFSSLSYICYFKPICFSNIWIKRLFHLRVMGQGNLNGKISWAQPD